MPEQLFDFAERYGLPVAMLIIALIGVLRGDWITKREHEKHMEAAKTAYDTLQKDRDEWRQFCLQGTIVVKQAVQMAQSKEGISS